MVLSMVSPGTLHLMAHILHRHCRGCGWAYPQGLLNPLLILSNVGTTVLGINWILSNLAHFFFIWHSSLGLSNENLVCYHNPFPWQDMKSLSPYHQIEENCSIFLFSSYLFIFPQPKFQNSANSLRGNLTMNLRSYRTLLIIPNALLTFWPGISCFQPGQNLRVQLCV